MIDTAWGPVSVDNAVYRVPLRGDVVIIGQNSLKEKIGIDIMAQLNAHLY